MKKYKKIITGLILGLICAILPFVSVVKAKALTVEEITTLNDLKGTSWKLNETIINSTIKFDITYKINGSITKDVIGTYSYGNYSFNIANNQTADSSLFGKACFMSVNYSSGKTYITLYSGSVDNAHIIYDENTYQDSWFTNGNYGENPRLLTFLDFSGDLIISGTNTNTFLSWLKQNAVLQQVQEPTTRTIPFRISFITNVFSDRLEYINSSIINLPVYNDTVSFTVSFENNKMITGQIEHPESADELGELTFSNGERVFYTIYYNETNIEFKLYFYGEQLFLYEAVMYNTEVLDSGGNYQATVATYSEGISEQEMETLKNSGIYEASFDITIPQEVELVTDAQLMLEIGILEGSEPPGFDNITNIMTGIFTLVSSFLSIQLGFITLGQIIGLILAIGVIFFIFYVWNGGRNGN